MDDKEEREQNFIGFIIPAFLGLLIILSCFFLSYKSYSANSKEAEEEFEEIESKKNIETKN